MSTPAACFENIIGLSRTDCTCVDDRPEDAGTSASGLYLDELPGLNLLMANAASKCGQGSLWDMLERARENAIEEVKSDLMGCINANTDARRQGGISQIGSEKKISGDRHAMTNTYHGLAVQTAMVKGGTFKIVAIGTAFKADSLPATIEVNVYERESVSSAPLGTYTLPCTANKLVWYTLPTPLELPMTEYGTTNPRYSVLFQPVAGMKAMNTLINCACGGFAPYWNVDNPQYMSSQQKGGQLWAEWCMAGGVKGDTLADRDLWVPYNPTNGLLLRVQFSCDETSTFCSDEPDYTGDPIQKVIAHAVRYKAGANLITDLLSSTAINQYTMTAGEQLMGNRSSYNNEYRRRVAEYLCPTLSQKENVNRYGDCRRCKDTGLRRGLIRN